MMKLRPGPTPALAGSKVPGNSSRFRGDGLCNFSQDASAEAPPRGVLSRKELQVDEHPLTGFAEGPAGQRARLLGTGKDVWEVIAAVRDNGGDPAETARYLEMPLRLVRGAIAYYGTHSDEIDQWIDLNAGEAAEAHAAFAAEQATSPR
jgi:hypothetical protein